MLLQKPNRQLFVAVARSQLRTMASETSDPIDWPLVESTHNLSATCTVQMRTTSVPRTGIAPGTSSPGGTHAATHDIRMEGVASPLHVNIGIQKNNNLNRIMVIFKALIQISPFNKICTLIENTNTCKNI